MMEGASVAFHLPCIGDDDVVERGIGLAKTCESDLDHHPARCPVLSRRVVEDMSFQRFAVKLMPKPFMHVVLPRKSPISLRCRLAPMSI